MASNLVVLSWYGRYALLICLHPYKCCEFTQVILVKEKKARVLSAIKILKKEVIISKVTFPPLIFMFWIYLQVLACLLNLGTEFSLHRHSWYQGIFIWICDMIIKILIWWHKANQSVPKGIWLFEYDPLYLVCCFQLEVYYSS